MATALGLSLLLAAGAAPGQGMIFPEVPEVFLGPSLTTASVTAGDIDLDGDLDVVFGNTSAPLGSSLYLNRNGGFPQTIRDLDFAHYFPINDIAVGDVNGDGQPDLICASGYALWSVGYYSAAGGIDADSDWQSSDIDNTTDVALGDVNGDGFLDLVCGIDGASNLVYFGTATGLETTPGWRSTQTNATQAVVLGDVNKDGWLDVVCGNGGDPHQPNTLYLNHPPQDGNPAYLDTLPVAWVSADSSYTTSLALGDLDGDTWLDLVCGNRPDYNEESWSTVHLNADSMFNSIPDALWGGEYDTRSVALGDLDGDGDLDLVAGNENEVNIAYLNRGNLFNQRTEDWNSWETTLRTRSVALVDVNGDGSLDLVCGNYEQENTCYLNQSGPFSKEPESFSTGNGVSWCTALGDVNGDGYADLVVGNGNQVDESNRNLLFLNQGGYFLETPDWPELEYFDTRAVLLADLNRDDNLDLVAGNYYGADQIYPGTGTSFADTTWWSGGGSDTHDLAVGDIDGNGWPDLVCANHAGPNALYLNGPEGLVAAAEWSRGSVTKNRSVALGDLDGDRDLDLVCGTFDGGRIYTNTDDGLATEGFAFSTDPQTEDIALGDINGDGWLDIACGNFQATNKVYLNQGYGVFRSTFDWDSPGSHTTIAVALEDVDADGDLDLLSFNFYESAQDSNKSSILVFLNEKGELSRDGAAWSYQPITNTRGVAVADVDLDGDPDIVCANENLDKTLFRGRFGAGAMNSQADPTLRLPNHAVELRKVAATEQEGSKNLYDVTLRAVDLESDPVWIMPEYQLRGDPTWYPATLTSVEKALGPFASSPEGTQIDFTWLVDDALIDTRHTVLRMRAISGSDLTASEGRIPTYLYDAGPLAVFRPEITIPVPRLEFPVVTQGDEKTENLIIRNSGTELLTVNNPDFDPDEMSITPALPRTLEPDSAVTLEVTLHPRTWTAVPETLWVTSNDPLTPAAGVPMIGVIRELDYEIETRLLAPVDEAPLGRAITIITTPGPDVVIEEGQLIFRASSSTDWTDTLDLVYSEPDFYAVIPNEKVTEAGLDYFLLLENSDVFATDPPGAPAEDFKHQDVESSSDLGSIATLTSENDWLAERAIHIAADLDLGTVFESGTLSYRRGGEAEYRTLPLIVDGVGPSATIPDTMVGPRGVEYYLEVSTLTGILSDPTDNPGANCNFLPIKVNDLAEEAVTPAQQYRMISFPLEFPAEFTGDLETLLFKQYGSYDPVQWRCFRWLPDVPGYAEWSDDQEAFRPEPGRAYWFIAKKQGTISTGGNPGYSPSSLEPWTMTLKPGWNQIGDPFGFAVAWASVRVDEQLLADAASLVEWPVAWDPTASDYDPLDPDRLEPFHGYFVNNVKSPEGDVVLTIPAVEAPVVVDAVDADKGVQPVAGGWRISLTTRCGDVHDRTITAGVHPLALVGRDELDHSRPPAPPGRRLEAQFLHKRSSGRLERLVVDMQPETGSPTDPAAKDGAGRLWRLDLIKNYDDDGMDDQVALEFTDLDKVPDADRIVLVDRVTDTTTDLRQEPIVTIPMRRGTAASRPQDSRFILLVGDEDFLDASLEFPEIPAVTALRRNRPNPFNPTTLIRFDLHKPARLRLGVYDLRGRRVCTLRAEDLPAGRHEALWDGKDQAGRSAATGVYFLRMTTDAGFGATHKMTLIR